MKLIDVYNERTMEYIGSFEKTNTNILNYVAGLLPFECRRLVDAESDNLVLTTIGDFLDYVPDKIWLEEIRSSLIERQTGEVEIDNVKLFSRYENE